MIDHTQVKLGKLAPHPASVSKRVDFVRLVGTDLPAPAPSRDYTMGVTKRPMFGNDAEGDCTCAAIANMFVGWLLVVYGKIWLPTTADVLALYSAITGFDPSKTDAQGNNPTDKGAVIEDVLTYVELHGFFGHHLIGSAAVDPTDVVNIKRAIDWFGYVDLGVGLCKAWQGQKKWDVPTLWQRVVARAAWAVGSWGGHCVCSQKYDEGGLYVWSWGELYYVTWAAVAMYFDTVDVVLSATWIGKGQSPAGLDEATLRSRMAALKADI